MWFRTPRGSHRTLASFYIESFGLLNPIETSKTVSNYYIDTLVAHFLWIQYYEILFMLCVSSSFIKSSRPWNIQVGQRSVGAQHVQGPNILCFSNGLTVPLSHKKMAVWNAICRCYPTIVISPLYLIGNLHLASPPPTSGSGDFQILPIKMLFMGKTYI